VKEGGKGAIQFCQGFAVTQDIALFAFPLARTHFNVLMVGRIKLRRRWCALDCLVHVLSFVGLRALTLQTFKCLARGLTDALERRLKLIYFSGFVFGVWVAEGVNMLQLGLFKKRIRI
jgi:hypothetical protein